MLEWYYSQLEKYSGEYDNSKLASITSIVVFCVVNLYLNLFFGIFFYFENASRMSIVNLFSFIIHALAIYLILIRHKLVFGTYLAMCILCVYITGSTYLFGYEKNAVILLSTMVLVVHIIVPLNLIHRVILSVVVAFSFLALIHIRYHVESIYSGQFMYLEYINVGFAFFCTIFIIYTEKIGRRFVDTYSEKRLIQLESKLNRDFLTGLWNRRFMEQEFNKKHTYINAFMIFADIDYFKNINDSFGHSAGDYVLKEISKIFVEKFSETDIVCRWGGEEFLIFAKDIIERELFEKVENIRAYIENYNFTFEGNSFNVTLSFGVRKTDNNIEMEKNIEYADKALYYAKDSGRNKVVNYDTMN